MRRRKYTTKSTVSKDGSNVRGALPTNVNEKRNVDKRMPGEKRNNSRSCVELTNDIIMDTVTGSLENVSN